MMVWLTYILAWPFIGFMALTCLWCEYQESNGAALFWAVIATVLAVKLNSLPMDYIGIILGIYIPCGILWSFWRWKKHCAKALKHYLKGSKKQDRWGNPDGERTRALDKMDVAKQKSLIVYWILGWPWGVAINLTRDIVIALEDFVSTTAKRVFDRLSSSARNEVEEEAKKHVVDEEK